MITGLVQRRMSLPHGVEVAVAVTSNAGVSIRMQRPSWSKSGQPAAWTDVGYADHRGYFNAVDKMDEMANEIEHVASRHALASVDELECVVRAVVDEMLKAWDAERMENEL